MNEITKPKNSVGRPPKPIDWDRVERKMEAGCTAVEISSHFRIHPTTFVHKFKEKYGDNFSNFSNDFHSDGKGNVREKQYEEALDGNTQMLVLLGKLWLGQVDIEPEPKKTEDFNLQNELMKKDHIIAEQQALLTQNNIEFNAVQNQSEAE